MTSDTYIMTGIIALFLVTGTLLPIVHGVLGSASSENDVDGLVQNLGASPIGFVVSIGTMFFWSFGSLPFWLDLFFLIPRSILAYLIYRGIRGI